MNPPSKPRPLSSVKPNPNSKVRPFSQNKRAPLLDQNNKEQIFAGPTNYRIAQPFQNSDVSMKFWKDVDKKVKDRRYSAREDHQAKSFIGFDQNTNLDSLENIAKDLNSKVTFQTILTQNEKPFSFLSSLGGKNTSFFSILNPSCESLPPPPSEEANREEIAEKIKAFSQIDMDRDLKSQLEPKKLKRKNKPKRPMTVASNITLPSNPPSNRFRISNEKRLTSALSLSRPAPPPPPNRPFTALPPPHLPSLSRPVTGKRPFSALNKGEGGKRSSLQREIIMKNQFLFEEEGYIREDLENDELFEEEVRKQEEISKRYSHNPHETLKNTFTSVEPQDPPTLIGKISRPLTSSLLQSRPISGMSAHSKQFFNVFSKFTKFNEIELPYEELFDRNERTIAATFAKFGDLGYYAPIQRIGLYMQFGAKLRRDHLVEIINLQKTITNVEKSEFEIPIQLGIIDDLNPFQNKTKTGISTPFQQEDVNRTPVTLSLYPEYIEDDSLETNSSSKAAQNFFHKMLIEMRGNYDPEHLGRSNYPYLDPATFPPLTTQKLTSSLHRYNHYINSDIIRLSEISKYKKEWLTNAFSLVDERLLSFEDCVRLIFQEIFENYTYAMKKAILDYILRSPNERKRLHIELLPRNTLCSAERIGREGGFSIMLYPDWHNFVVRGKEGLTKKIIILNIINTSLLHWFQDFSSFLLLETSIMKMIGVLGHSLDLPAFMRLENTYRTKTVSVLKNIWLRGCFLIIRKFKFLRKSSQKNGVWTFNGFKEDRRKDQRMKEELKTGSSEMNLSSMTGASRKEEEEMENENIYQSMLHTKIEEEVDLEGNFNLFAKVSFTELQDIRENPAYRIYLLSIDKQLKLTEEGWKDIPKETRTLILESAGNLMSLQLRTIIENSIQKMGDFILSIPSYKPRAAPEFINNLEVIQQSMGEEEGSLSSLKYRRPSKFLEMNIPITTESMGLEDPSLSKNNISFEQNSLIKPLESSMLDESRRRRPSGIHMKMQKLNEKPEDKSILTLSRPDLPELMLIELDFLNYQKEVYPFLKLELILNEEGLQFKEKEDYIKQEFTLMLKNMITSFDEFLHPKYGKVVIEKEAQNFSDVQIARRQAFQAENNFMTLDHDTIYGKMFGFVRFKESKQQRKNQSLFESNIVIEEDRSHQCLKIANANEKCYINFIQKILQHVIGMYRECQISFQIFQQFKIFIDRNVHKEIDQFLSKKSIRLDEYKTYVQAFNKFEGLIHRVPNNIYFPMFDVSCEKVKQTIFNIIDDLRTKVLSHLEVLITNSMKKVCERYNAHTNYIRRSTIKAEEVEAMEKYIYDLTADKIVLKQQMSDNFSKFIFLLKLDHVCSENLLSLTKELYDWPALLDKELKSNEEKHLIERSRLEESLKHRRTEFEQKLEVHGEDIKGVESFTEYNKYKSYITEIETLEGLLEDLRKEMEEISDQENKLFGYNSNYDKFAVLESILKPHAELWKVLGDFVHHKKIWLNSPVWSLEPNEMLAKIKMAGKSATKLGNVLENGSMSGRIIRELKEDLETMGNYMGSVEILANKGLKERHWEQINEILKGKFDWKEGCLKEVLGKGVEKNLKEYLHI